MILHLHSKAMQGTETEYILHYAALSSAFVFKFVAVQDVFRIDLRFPITKLIRALPCMRKFSKNLRAAI